MDEKGFFRIVDRKKDMIKVSGFMCSPTRIENVIASNPKVLEVAAIGVPDAKSGEVIKVIRREERSESHRERMIDYCHKNNDQTTRFQNTWFSYRAAEVERRQDHSPCVKRRGGFG